MHKGSRVKIIILFSGVALIALSLMLFVSAMITRDFGQESFFSGRSSTLLIMAFAMLGGLAITLLFIVSRTSNSPVSGDPKEKRVKTRVPVTNTHQSVEGSAGPHTSAELLSETAGELRTSVGAIQEELEEILDDEIPADKEQMLSLYQETDRLRKIIDGMEQLSHAQALARSLKKEPLQLEPLLKGIIEKTRASAGDKNVTFKLECEPGLAMAGDSDCIGIIIGNIADNAVKAVKDSGSVTLTAKRTGGQMVFSVADTGIGIRRSHLAHIYERFFRGTGSGVGMGLSIVKELVDACRGKIEVQTESGNGSIFTVHIPAA